MDEATGNGTDEFPDFGRLYIHISYEIISLVDVDVLFLWLWLWLFFGVDVVVNVNVNVWLVTILA